MNTTAITGTIATVPRFRFRRFVPTTTFDIHVDVAHRTYTFHIRAVNALATQSRHLHVNDPVAITGYLHAEPYDMPDRSIWHRVEIVLFPTRSNTAPSPSRSRTASAGPFRDCPPRKRRTRRPRGPLGRRRHRTHRVASRVPVTAQRRRLGRHRPRRCPTNDRVLGSGEGPLRSCYPIPDELVDSAECDDVAWVITDDLADSDPLTILLWPSDC